MLLLRTHYPRIFMSELCVDKLSKPIREKNLELYIGSKIRPRGYNRFEQW